MKNVFEKLKKIYLLLPFILLMVAVYCPFVANMFSSNTELLDNRVLSPKPVKFSSDFSRNYEQYYNDTFAGRKKLVVKYVKLKQKLKIDTGQYFYGQNDWIFYDAAKVNNGNTVLDYLGAAVWDNEELEQLTKALEKEQAFYEEKGAKYLLMVVPNKENVYAEYMPERLQKIRKSDSSLSDIGIKYLQENTRIEILNLKPILLAAKTNCPYNIYYKKDTHWNALGAYIAFESLLKSFNKLGIDGTAKPLLSEMITTAGLIGQDMHPTDKDMSYHVSFMDDRSFEKKEIVPNKVIVYENQNPLVDKVILIIGDSFAGEIIPYIAKVYRRVINIPAGVKDLSFYQDIATEYMPNLVVHELVERYFSRLGSLEKLYESKK